MKKALFTSIILCAVAITSSAQELPWFWHENDYALKGHVKEVREYHIEMRGDPELQDTDYYFYTYSPDGHILTEYFDDVDKLCHNTYYWSTHLDSIVRDGDCHSIEYYLYDNNGRLNRVIYGVPGHIDTLTVLYDDRGFPTKTSGDKLTKPWYEWYDDGRIKGIGSKHWSKRYEYDSLGRLKKESYQDKHVVTYTYNEQGDIALMEENSNGTNQGKVTKTSYTYKYDSHGNWIEQYRGKTLIIIRIINYYE
jgi:hypothetical protein